MATVLQKIRRRLNERFGIGIKHTILYSLASPASPSPAEPPPGVTVDILRDPSAGMLNSIGGICERDIRERLSREDLCYVAYLQGKLAHYSWVQRSGKHDIEPAATVHDVAAGEIWIYHCETAPWARGNRIYPFVLSTIVSDHIRQGFGGARIYTTGDNIASQKGILRVGFRQYAVLRVLRLGKWVIPCGSASG
jgi:hypothetical protein